MKTQKDLLQDFINAMTYASGASWQMVHTHSDPRFIQVREMLDSIKNSCMQLALGPSDAIREKMPKSNLIIMP